jgi:hypothetical protein
MTRIEPGSSHVAAHVTARGGRPLRGDRVPATGYSHRGTGRSIDDVRGRGREALAATRGATALALSPAVAPPRRRAQPAEPTQPTRDEQVRTTGTRDSGARATGARAATPVRGVGGRRPPTASRIEPDSSAVRIRTAGPARKPVTEPEPQARPAVTVVPPLPVSAPRAPFVTLVLVVVIVGVLGILVINTKINENAFRLHDIKAQQGDLDRHEQRLQLEIAEKASPGNLAAAARQLGLVRADSPAFLRLPDGRSLGVPRPATGPTSAAVPGQPASQPASQPAGQPGG